MKQSKEEFIKEELAEFTQLYETAFRWVRERPSQPSAGDYLADLLTRFEQVIREEERELTKGEVLNSLGEKFTEMSITHSGMEELEEIIKNFNSLT